MKREYINPEEVAKMFGLEKLPDYITFNPDLTKRNGAQYEIVRQANHDRTFAFIDELLQNTLVNVLNKDSYCIGQDIQNAKDVRYEIGLIRLATVYGDVELPAGKYPGQKDRTRMPVKCILS